MAWRSAGGNFSDSLLPDRVIFASSAGVNILLRIELTKGEGVV